MTSPDSNLLDELHDAIAEQVGDISAPADLAARARRIARRRTGTRAVAVGVSMLVAVGVGVGVAVGGRSATTIPTTSSAHVAPLTVTAPVAHARSTAYIVRHVRAKLTATGRAGVVFEIIDRGSPRYQTFMYVDSRTGVQYQRSTAFSRRGTKLFTNLDVATPVHDVLHFHTVSVDYQDHTWTEGNSVASGPMPKRPVRLHHPSLMSSPHQIQDALEHGTVRQAGTARVNGTQALVLSLGGHVRSRLYVDARTYRPLRAVVGFQTWTWLPAVPVNITRARGLTIPAGYRHTPASS